MDVTTVQEAVQRLEAAGQSVSVRTVRHQLGRGSLRDVARLLRMITAPRPTGATMVTAPRLLEEHAAMSTAETTAAPPASAPALRAPASATNHGFFMGTVLGRPTAEHTFDLHVPFRGGFVTVPCVAPDLLVRQLGAESAVCVAGSWARSVEVEIGYDAPTVFVVRELAPVPALGLQEKDIGANMCWIAGVLPTTKVDLAEIKSHETPHGTITLRLNNGAKMRLVLLGERAMRRVQICSPGDKIVIGGPVCSYRGALGVLAVQWTHAW